MFVTVVVENVRYVWGCHTLSRIKDFNFKLSQLKDFSSVLFFPSSAFALHKWYMEILHKIIMND